MVTPIDTATGQPSGPAVHDGGPVDVLVGWLVTLPDGLECRLGADETRARNYALNNHSVQVEPMFVRRLKGQKLPTLPTPPNR